MFVKGNLFVSFCSEVYYKDFFILRVYWRSFFYFGNEHKFKVRLNLLNDLLRFAIKFFSDKFIGFK